MNSSWLNIPRLWNSSFGLFPNGSISPKLHPPPPSSPDGSLRQDLEIQRIATICYVIALAAISLFENTSLLAIFIKFRAMRTTANCFIINMAISDVLYVVFVIPPGLEATISRSMEWKLGSVLGLVTCKLTNFIRDVSFTVSILNMVAMACDRFYAVVYPIRRKPRCLEPRIAIPVIWLLSMSSFANYFYVYRLVVHPVQKTLFCASVWTPAFDQEKSPRRQYLFVVCAFFVFPLISITVLYGIIIHTLKRHNIPGARTTETERLRRQRNRSITKVGVLIVLCFFLSWAPYHCLMVLIYFLWNPAPTHHLRKTIEILLFFFTSLSLTSVASNAFVCYACSSKFRCCLKKMLSCFSCPSGMRQRAHVLGLNSRSNGEQLPTQSSTLHDNGKTTGIINKGISTGETVEWENGWDTKL